MGCVMLLAGVPSVPEAALQASAKALAGVLMMPKSAHAATAAAALGHAGLRGPLPLPPPSASEQSTAAASGSTEPAAAAEPMATGAAELSLQAVLKALTAMMGDKDVKVGMQCNGWGRSLPQKKSGAFGRRLWAALMPGCMCRRPPRLQWPPASYAMGTPQAPR